MSGKEEVVAIFGVCGLWKVLFFFFFLRVARELVQWAMKKHVGLISGL